MSKNKTHTTNKALRNAVAILLAISLAFLQWPIGSLAREAAADASDEAQARLAQATSIDVPIEFEHAYITYDDQIIAQPATKVTIPSGSELKFTATADSGYQVESVTATIDDKETKVTPDDKGVYKLTAAEAAVTTKLLVRAITAPTVESVEVSAAAAPAEPAAAAEPVANAEPAAPAESAATAEPATDGTSVAQEASTEAVGDAPAPASEAAETEPTASSATTGEPASSASAESSASSEAVADAASSQQAADANKSPAATNDTKVLNAIAAETQSAAAVAAAIAAEAEAKAAAQVNTRTEFSYADEEVSVTATLSQADAVPANVIFQVKPITAGSSGYNYDAYMQALNNSAADTAYTPENTLLYDVAFMVPKTDAEGNEVPGELVEFQPAAGTVALSFAFHKGQLATAASAEGSTDVSVIHLPLADAVRDAVDSTEDATAISAGDVVVENVQQEASIEDETVSFTLDSLSATAVTTASSGNVATLGAAPGARTSSNLAEFLTNAIISAPTNEAGEYIIVPDVVYAVTLTFSENPTLQFPNDGTTMVYEMPKGLDAVDGAEGALTIKVNDGGTFYNVSNNKYRIQDGKLYFDFNTADPNFSILEASNNAKFTMSFDGSFTANTNGISFSDGVSRDIAVDTSSNVHVSKTSDVSRSSGVVAYTVTVRSDGKSENVVVTDAIQGDVLSLKSNSFVISSSTGRALSAQPNVNGNTFTYTIPEMSNGEIITIKYRAGIDVSKIPQANGQRITYENNTVRVESDNDPTPETANHSTKIDYTPSIDKSDPTLVSEDGDKKTLSWTITANEKMLVTMAGGTISDRISSSSKDFMVYSGPGITVTVYDGDNVVRTDNVRWDQLTDKQDDRWTYTVPASDADHAYKYVITYTTEADLSGRTGMTPVKNEATTDGGKSSHGEDEFMPAGGEVKVAKSATNVDIVNKEISWKVTFNVPEAGLIKAAIKDTIPSIWLNNGLHREGLVEGSVHVEGLIGDESYSVHDHSYDADLNQQDQSYFRITFYKSKDHSDENQGLNAGPARTITTTFKTVLDPEWFESGKAEQWRQIHVNKVRLDVNDEKKTAQAEATAIGPSIDKEAHYSGTRHVGNVELPVYQYDVVLSNVTSDVNVVEDLFDTSLLEPYMTDDWDSWYVFGGDTWSQDYRGGKFGYTFTPNGMTFTTDEGCMPHDPNSPTGFYDKYKLVYYLTVKDAAALNTIVSRAAADPNGTCKIGNTAVWNDGSATADVEYKYKGLTKEILTPDSELSKTDEDIWAEFRITLNPSAQTLNGGANLTMTDTFENLSIDYDSITPVPSEGVTWDVSGNVVTYSIPDSTKITITYKARVVVDDNGAVGETKHITFSNKAEMNNYTTTLTKNAARHNSGQGSASVPVIKLLKYEAGDMTHRLAGAKFQLLDADKNPVLDKDGQPVTFTTPENGIINIRGDQENLGWALNENTRYYLRELIAPPGYMLSDFDYSVQVSSDGTTNYAEYVYHTGDTMSAKNYKGTDVKVAKEWSDGNAQHDGDEVTVKLQQKVGDGDWSDVIRSQVKDAQGKYSWVDTPQKTLRLNAGNKWEGTFAGLPIAVPIDINNVNGEDVKVDYRVVETIVNGTTPEEGTVSVEGGLEGGTYAFTVENKSEAKTTSATVRKVWNDADNVDGRRPAALTVQLSNGAQTVAQVELNEGNRWAATVDNLPKFNGKNEIAYTWLESSMPQGYSLEGTTKDGTITTITNKHTPEKVEIPVRKVWDDDNNRDGLRKTEVTVKLMKMADGKVVEVEGVSRLKLSEANKWQNKFTDLPKYKDGKEIAYTVEEDTTVSPDYEKSVSGNMAEGFVITNTHTPETTTVSGTKSWSDNNNADGNRPTSVTVHLLADGADTGMTATATEAGGWNYTFENLPVYKQGATGQIITYTVSESDFIDYAASVTGDGLLNTFNPERTTVTVKKVWDDANDEDGMRPDSVTVQLLRNGAYFDHAELNAANNWTYTWDNLVKRYKGADAVYTVREGQVAGYNEPAVTGSMAEGYTITNKRDVTPSTNLTIIKTSAANTNARLVGAKFELTPVNPTGEAVTATTNADGVVTFDKLKRGATYTLQEKVAPGGYQLDERLYHLSVSNDENLTVTCTDENGLEIWGNKVTGFVTAVYDQPDEGYGKIVVRKNVHGSGVDGPSMRSSIGVRVENIETGDYVEFTGIGRATKAYRTDLKNRSGQSVGTVTIRPVEAFDSQIENLPSGTYRVTETADGLTDFSGANGAKSGAGETYVRTTTYSIDGNQTQLIGTSSTNPQTLAIDNTYYGNGRLVLTKEFGWQRTGLVGTYAGNLLGGKEEGDSGATGQIMSNITFTITGQKTGEVYTIAGNKFNSSAPTQITSASGNTTISVAYQKQQWTITNLPYDTYTVVESSDGYRDEGQEIDTILHKFYTTGTFEVTNDHGTSNVIVGGTTGTRAGEGVSESGATVDVSGDDASMDILNVYYRPKVVEVTKRWDIPAGSDFTPRDIEVQLVRSINCVDNSVEGSAKKYFYPVTSADVPEHPGYVTRKTLHYNAETGAYDKAIFSQLPAVTANGEQITYEVREVSADGTLVPMIGGYTNENGEPITEGNFYTDGNGNTATVSFGAGWNPGKAPYADVDGVSRYYSSDKGITLVNKLETTEVSGTKIWNDANDQDGLRPTSVTVNLLADGTKVASQAATAANNWAYSFTNLPKYKDGKEIAYTVAEDAVSGYETAIAGTAITNTHTPEKTAVSVKKVWDDGNNRDGKRPANIHVQLIGADGNYGGVVELNEGNSWSYTWNDLPKNRNGKAIEYRVTETDAPAEYTVAYTGTSAAGLVITDSYTPGVTNVSVTKAWEDSFDQDGVRPDAVSVQLYADGAATGDAVELSEAAGWSYTWNDLPLMAAGKAITYTVREVEGDWSKNYTTKVSGTAADGFTITNTHAPATTELSGEKTWADDDNHDGLRPESVTVRLLADGTEKESATISAATDWKYAFTNLPKFAAGKEIAYTVTEDAVAHYTTTSDGANFTNTHAPEKTQVSVVKAWNDENDHDGLRPNAVTVQLYADGEASGTAVTLDDANNWAHTWTDLDKLTAGREIVYTVAEIDGKTGAYTTSDPTWNNELGSFVITNTHVPEKTSVSGTKTWSDSQDQDGKRPSSITVNLLANGEKAQSKTVVADKDGNWSFEFANLDKYADGKEIEYTVSEEAVEGYTATISGSAAAGFTIDNAYTPEKTDITVTKAWNDANDQDGLRPETIQVRLTDGAKTIGEVVLSADNDWTYTWKNLDRKAGGKDIPYAVEEVSTPGGYTTATTGSVSAGFTITNTHVPEQVNIEANKAWNDAGNQDGKRADGVQVQLSAKANGNPVDLGQGVVMTTTLNAANNWHCSWAGLPAKHEGAAVTYSVTELGVPTGYTNTVTSATTAAANGVPQITTFTVGNDHAPEKTFVSGKKTWVDNDNNDNMRPASIVVHVWDGDTEVARKEVTAAEGWTYTIDGLAKYRGGQEISYRVTEDAVAGYTTTIDGYDITNTHQPETTSVSGAKTWSDGDDRDGKRPESIVVRVWNGDKEAATATVRPDAQGNWSYEITGLPKFENQREIAYTVTEDVPDGYTATVNGTNIVNTRTPETTTVEGSKVWDDANNQDGQRPASVTVNLLADGAQIDSQTVTAANNWAYAFTNLPKYRDHGTAIVYTVTENAVPGYAGEVEGTTITNTHTPEKTQVSGTKTWNDNDNQDGKRPTSITVNLLADGVKAATKTVSPDSEGNWSYMFDNLDKFKNGVEVVYTVEEVPVAAYTTTVDGFNITNTHTPELIDLSGAKHWEDANNQDGIRPTSITVHLLANGKSIRTTTATAEGGWAYSFTGLPKYEGGKEIVYTVSEEKVEGYAPTVDGVDITNTHVPEKTSARVTKTWADADNQDGKRPAKITVHLLADGNEVRTQDIEPDANGNWSYEFTNLDKNANGRPITYTVTEDAVAEYTATYNGTAITNTHVPETTEVSGAKVWNDANDQDGARPQSITVRLLADGDEYKTTTVTPDGNGNWAYSFTDLPKYKAGKEIAYTVTEDDVPGYERTIAGTTITNKRTPAKTEVEGTKTWDDNNNQDGKRPASITVNLLADGVQTQSAVVEPDANGAWAYKFTNLDKYAGGKEIVYTVEEAPVADYQASYSGTNITNKHAPDKTSVSGVKTWNDADNQDGKRPASITVNLLANGQNVDSKTVTESDGWKYEFTDLDRYANGAEIVYTVTEEPVAEYTTAINGYNIANTHAPETVDLSGSKTWNDADNQDGVRPASITVHLLADGKQVATTTATAENNWAYSFADQPRFANGKEITYTVSEEPVEGYTAATSGMDLTNTHAPETTEVSGAKTWNDNDDQDGLRPASITVRLWSDKQQGEVASQEVKPAADGTWSYAFTNLPKRAAGELIAYSVTEDRVNGYGSGVVTGFDIANTHTPATTEVSGAKIWDDANDQDGKRPASITVHLLANDKVIDTKTVTEADGWEYTFTDLPVNEDHGKAITYTVTEDPVANYTTEANGYNFTNSYTPEKTSVSGKKTWNDANDQDGLRPASITVHLLADGKEVASKTVAEADGWAYEFTNLPKFRDGGTEIAYTVSEDAVVGYQASVNGMDITNTHTPATTEVSGAKTWEDADNQDGKRPASITVNLFADNQKIDSKTVTEADGWAYSFTNLPQYRDGGKAITYTVTEDAVADYATTVAGTAITNTHTPATTSVTGAKVWDDDDNRDGKRPKSITVNLLANGVKADSRTIAPDENGVWPAFTFSDLPVYKGGERIAYTLTEDAVAFYEAAEISFPAGTGAIIKNTYKPVTTEVSGTKTWSDANNQDGKRPTKITVRLLADGAEIASKDVTAADNWSYKFENLPKFRDGGTEIAYTVTEDAVEDYTTTIDGYAIKNVHTPEITSVNVAKIWNDENDYDGLRPNSITVRLFADGTEIDHADLNVAGNWSCTFGNLPKYRDGGTEIKYTIAEDAVDHYTTTIDGYTIINTHAPEKVTVNGKKTWSDANNQDGKRPNSITVDLLANGTVKQSATVTPDASGNWTFSFAGLDKYADGKEIAYTVAERQVEGYTATIAGSAAAGFTIDNAYAPEKTAVKVAKTWDDGDDLDGFRPASITVHLTNGTDTLETVELNSDNNWAHEWTGLDRYANGVEIPYTVVEDAVPNYAAELTGSITSGFTLKNTHAPTFVDVKADKVWNDADNQDGKRARSVTVRLSATVEGAPITIDGVSMTATLSEASGWHHEWSNLPQLRDGKTISYTLSEVSASDGYATAVRMSQTPATATANAAIAFTVTNDHTPELVDISATKTWNDAGDQDGKRPASVMVQLFAGDDPVLVDGTPVTAELTEQGGWTHTFTGLPKYADGAEIAYRTVETAVPADYEVTATGTKDNGYAVANDHTPELTNISVVKVWDDADNQDGKRADSVTVQLNGPDGAVGEPVVLNNGNSWSYAWENLPKYHGGDLASYSVVELDVPDDYTATVTGDAATGFTVTNTHTPGVTNVSVVKAWNDADNQDGVRADSVSVQLYADGVASGEPVVLNEDNSWAHTWSNLPQKAAGVDIAYTVDEVGTPAGYASAVAGDAAVGFTVTNTHTPETTTVNARKVWNDADNQDGIRPSSVRLQLRADGVDVGDPMTLDASNGWKTSWNDLPKKAHGVDVVYTVLELDTPAGYTVAVEDSSAADIVVTNSHTPELTTARVNKVWDDADNQDGKRPAQITAQLLANDGAYGEPVTLSAGNGWSYQWANLPKFAAGKEIAYSVTEAGVPDDYTAKVEGSREAGFVITNSYTPGVTNVTVSKAWDDASNQDGLRPASVKVRLLADGAPVSKEGVAAEVELNEDNHWAYTWENLDQMKAGSTIAYTVEEVDVPAGYRATTAGDAASGFTITNAHTPELTEVEVSKEWNDDDNRDGMRPNGVALTLYADGVAKGSQTVVPDANGSWSYTFTNLPKFANAGTEVKYTITEEAVDGYAATIDGFTAKNTHDNETTEVRGTKTWNDRNNQDGTRPTLITVNLLADGVKVDSKTVTADDGWAYAFTNLNKFRDGGTPIVYTVDEDEVANYTKAVDGFNLANTPQVGGLTVGKAVENAPDPTQRFTFTVTLDDAKVQGAHGDMTFTDGVATVELAGGETAQAIDLPAGVGYTVTEAAVAGFTATSTGDTGTIAAGEIAQARFTNVYNATGTAEFYAMKHLDGRTLQAEEFSFELLEGGRVIQTITNAGDGHARFDAITYELADVGEHSYTIREVAGNVNGVSYDTQSHDFTVNVTDNGDGTLAVAYRGYDSATGAVFTNTYTPSGKVTVTTRKALDGAAPPAGAYEFQLADLAGNVIATARNATDGTVTFPELTFKAAGTYEYAITEVLPEGAQKLGDGWVYGGVFYDRGTSRVSIEAIDNFDGTLRFTTTYDNGTPKTFENTTAPEATFPLTATKAMAGRDFRAGDSFTFTVEGEAGAPMPASASATITPTSGAQATVNFGDITFTTDDLGRTYTYTVSEARAGETAAGVTNDPFSHWVKLRVVDAGDGTLGVVPEYENGAAAMTFTNTYRAAGEAQLTATKTLTGRALADGEFFFELTGDNLPAALHASAAADGRVAFAPIAFTQDDVGRDFHYAMRETAGTLGGVTYDTATHDITVHVEDNGDGTLAITYDYGEAGTAPVFHNAYRTDGTSARLTAHKALVGGMLSAGQFSFELRGTSANAAGTVQTVTNAADGSVSFDAISYSAPGVYEYRISEVVPAGAAANADGTFTGTDGIIYDGRSHTATVTVTDDGLGKLHAAVRYDGGASGISFGNTALVRTGFAFEKHYFGGVGTFDFTLTAADAQGNARTGTAADYSDVATIVDDGTQAFTATVQNGAFTDGVAPIVFPEIGYTADGDYYYVIAENESDTPDMITDRARYLAHVVVSAGAVASTTFELIYEGENLGLTEDLAFYNNSTVTLGFDSVSMKSYNGPAERTSVYPKAKKYLNDSTDALVGGEFTFELTDDATGEVLAVATNDEVGNVAFFDENTTPGLAFNKPGTYRYTMREVAGEEADMVYDSSAIAVVVQVEETDNGLVATTTYNGPGGGEPAFYNVKRGMDVTVRKVSRYGGEGLADCTYALWMAGDDGDALIAEATSDANGYITFKNVTLLAGQKYYFKEVEAPKGHTVDPYRTAYFSLNAAGDALVLVEDTAADGWHSATENAKND